MQKQIKSLVISNYNKTPSNKMAEADMLCGLVDKGVDVTVMTYSGNTFTKYLESRGINFIYHHPEKKYPEKAFVSFEIL